MRILTTVAFLLAQTAGEKELERLKDLSSKAETPAAKAAAGDAYLAAAGKFPKERKAFVDAGMSLYQAAWPTLEDAPKAKLREKLHQMAGVPAGYGDKPKNATGEIPGWAGADPALGRVLDDAFVHSGRRSVKLLPVPKDPPGSLSTIATIYLPCEPGKKYTYSAWVFSTGNDEDGALQLRLTDKGGAGVAAAVGKSAIIPVDSPWWQKVEGDVEIPPTAYRMHLMVLAKLRKGAVWVDDVSIMCDGKNVAKNGGFEDR